MSLYDKASLVQIPSGTKDGTLYSVLPANGDGDFTHTRASSATRVNKDGLIESVASGVPRLDYPLIDGVVQSCPALLLEPSRTNLVTYSQEFDGYTKYSVTVEDNFSISPDGSQNAAKLTDTDSYDTIRTDATVVSGSTYTISIFAKNPSSGKFALRAYSASGNDTRRLFNLSNLTVSGAGGDNTGLVANSDNIQDYGNGWYRCSFSYVPTSTSLELNIYPDEPTNTDSNSVEVYGFQCELGSYPTSYIPTSGSAVTRSFDDCAGAGTTAEFNDSEGVLFAEIQGLNDTDTSNRYISLSDGTPTNALMIQYRNNGELRLYNGGFSTPEMIYRDANAHATENIKVAIKYGTTTGSYKVYINGFSETIEGAFVATAMSGLDELKFEYALGGNNFYGNTKQIMTFNEALTDSELEQVTSWTSFSEMAKGQLY
jgi:hypothetical protein